MYEILQEKKTLAFFNPEKHTCLTVDASSTGLGAILAQETSPGSGDMKIIAYASKALTDTEQKYSSIERETLAVKWACHKFRLYLYGHDFTVYTDLLPLVALFKNKRAKLSLRIERWILDLQA